MHNYVYVNQKVIGKIGLYDIFHYKSTFALRGVFCRSSLVYILTIFVALPKLVFESLAETNLKIKPVV